MANQIKEAWLPVHKFQCNTLVFTLKECGKMQVAKYLKFDNCFIMDMFSD